MVYLYSRNRHGQKVGKYYSCCPCRQPKTTTTTTTTNAPSGGCFPSTSRIQLKNGKLLPMSELQIGDKIQTGKKNSF